MLRQLTIACVSITFAAVPALAQEPPPEPYEESYEEPPPEGAPYEEGAAYGDDAYAEDGSLRVVEQGSPEAQAMTAQEGRGIEVGAHLLVPIYLSVRNLYPGLGLQGRVGWEFPMGWLFELNIGGQFNRINDPVFEDSLVAFWFGVGGRYSFLNPSAVVPFVGLNVQVSFWSLCLDTGAGSCEGDVREAGLGLVPIVGVAYEINPQVALEGGLQTTLTFFREDNDLGVDTVEAYLSPFFGGTFYF